MVGWCDLFFEMEGSIMGQIRHGSATSMHAIRAAMRRSQDTNAALSGRGRWDQCQNSCQIAQARDFRSRKIGLAEPSSSSEGGLGCHGLSFPASYAATAG